MKLISYLLILLCGCQVSVSAQTFPANEPWTAQQLISAKYLAEKINANQTRNMLILGVGPDAMIKGSIDMGEANDPANIAKLKQFLKGVDKNKEVVIYCGCCPFDRCPNIRPAFKALKEMGFKNARLLNLTKNIRTNWLNEGYPIKD